MSTVAELIDRAYREFLYPADEQPTRFTLGADMALNATAFTVDSSFLTPEEESLLAPGTVVELDSELVQIGDYDESAATSQATAVKRAILGTAAAAHTSGAYGTIAPEHPRKVVFDAICDAIVGLYPDLYAVVTTSALALSSSSYTEVPATVMEPMYLWARTVGSAATDPYGNYPNVDFLDNFTPSSTGKAIIAPGFSGGGTGYLVHKAKFARPGSESVDLVTTTLLQAEWEQIVLVAAVAHLIAGKDMSSRQQEFITQQLGAQTYPVLTPTRVRESLLKYYEYLLQRAQKGLRAKNRATVNRVSVLP